MCFKHFLNSDNMKSASLPFKKNDKEVKGEKRNKRKESKSQCRQKPTKGKSSTPLFNVLTPKAPSPHIQGVALVPPPIINSTANSKATGNSNFTSVSPAAAAQTLAATLASNTAPSPNAQAAQKEKKTESDANFLMDRKEYKGTRRDKPQRTTIRKKKGSNTNTNTTTSDGKSSSEQDVKQRSKTDKRKESLSSDSKKSLENKSSGSKEPSDSEETKVKKKKHLQELSQRLRRRAGDFRLERMPDSSQLNVSVKALRKKINRAKSDAGEENLFRPNGEPIWVVPERAAEDCEKSEDGETLLNPELTAAMAELGIEMDETVWLDACGLYMTGELKKGTPLPENFQFDEYAPFDVLEENCVYISREAVIYGTAHSLVELVEGDAMKRYGEATDDGGERRKRPLKSMDSEGTCPTSSASKTSANSSETDAKSENDLWGKNGPSKVKFDLKSNVRFTYDRYHPIASIKKLCKRQNRSVSTEKTTQVESKENS